ncbi:hypothetical protein DE146DRAFT_645177 [Phaeosphaeria sp. MPI-PUGE-AT-0046c]|nr:hypothetical protein DE146DRAFT_645177 [Phaeosphaeria sp. MPI-PUGE-AT-0046c]
MEKGAIIIGGSIAGLMCGVMLKHHGYSVTILEQEVSSSREGYDAGIKIGPAVQAFLDKHDRVKRDMTITCLPGVIINIDGRPTAQRGQTMITTSWGLIVSVLRANFDGFTSTAVPVAPELKHSDGKATFRSGARATSVHEVGPEAEVTWLNIETGMNEALKASIVIVADGSKSVIRSTLLPDVKREYAGYMCWRGTVQEDKIDDKWNELYAERATFHLMDKTYLLNYTIPTDDGVLTKGKRLHNWLWYSNLIPDSPEMADLFTDVNGKVHRGTVPRNLVRPELWEKQKALAKQMLPEGIATIVQRTTAPFITKVFDSKCAKASFFNGKLFLVGDAQITLRPNIGMSTTHAANDCNELEKVIEGIATPQQWERVVLRWGAAQQRFAMTISAYGLESKLSALQNGVFWLGLLLGQQIGLL